MNQKVFLSIGNCDIENKIRELKEIDIIDSEENLDVTRDLLEYIEIDYLILNRLLDEKGEKLLDISRIAKKKNIKIIMLMHDFNSFEEKKLISALLSQEVYCFINIKDITKDKIIRAIKDYPNEFNFDLLAETKVIEKEKIVEKKIVETRTKVVRNQVITCYTTDDAFLSAEISTQLAVLLSENQKVLVIDFNNLNPVLDHFLNIKKEVPLLDKYDVRKQTSLVALVNAIERDKLDYDLFDKLTIKHNKYNISIITGLYDIILDDNIEKSCYEKIVDMAKELYDIVIINTNPYIKSASTFVAITKATKIIAAANANYAYIRNLLNTFKVLKGKINKEKIKLVITNVDTYSLDKSIINEITKGYEILAYLPEDNKKNYALNNQKIYIACADTKVKEAYMNIVANLGYASIKKRGLIQKLLRR